MAKKLYVGNLSYNTTEDRLHALFSEIGPVESVALIMDRQTGRSKGFAFVEMQNTADAQQAIERMHNSEVDGRPLTVNEAQPPKPRTFDGGGGGGGSRGGGGYGGGRSHGYGNSGGKRDQSSRGSRY